MNHARAGVALGAEQGAGRSQGLMPWQGPQRRAAPRATPARRVSTPYGRTRRCKCSPGTQPGCALRL